MAWLKKHATVTTNQYHMKLMYTADLPDEDPTAVQVLIQTVLCFGNQNVKVNAKHRKGSMEDGSEVEKPIGDLARQWGF